MGELALPRNILYATSARIGGTGLSLVVHETVRGIQDRLGLAIAFENNQTEVPASKLISLRWHPVRLLSFLESRYYYGAKKKALDRFAASRLRGGRFDLFHGWSGESLLTLRETNRLGIPSVIEIPTWHRDKGVQMPAVTLKELALQNAPLLQRWLNRLLVGRQQVLEEYRRATLLLVLSECAAESFRNVGFPESKLFKLCRAVDVERFRPGPRPSVFRALYVGALIKRKGVHHLLDAWRALQLPNAELWLVGHLHPEIEPYLHDAPPGIKLVPFTRRVEEIFAQSTIHVFPSECEGSAKVTYEASAAALPQVVTRESGDAVVDGETGIVVPPHDPAAIAEGILRLYENPALVAEMGAAARERMKRQFTWEHFIVRLTEAYRAAMTAGPVLVN
jgi:glycosyltransferase involved in cell wall biosynthesis